MGGGNIFNGREDHESFMYWLERVCGSHGWRVHAWVLMGNHFHLLLETPEVNLSSGMRVLLGGFSQVWNFRQQRKGHVFQGRYKSVPVAGASAADAHYFKSVEDYIHLNPARAGLTGGGEGKLVDYPSYFISNCWNSNNMAFESIKKKIIFINEKGVGVSLKIFIKIDLSLYQPKPQPSEQNPLSSRFLQSYSVGLIYGRIESSNSVVSRSDSRKRGCWVN